VYKNNKFDNGEKSEICTLFNIYVEYISTQQSIDEKSIFSVGYLSNFVKMCISRTYQYCDAK